MMVLFIFNSFRCMDVTSIDFSDLTLKCAVNGTDGPKWAGKVCQKGASVGATCMCCVKLNLTPEPTTPEPALMRHNPNP